MATQTMPLVLMLASMSCIAGIVSSLPLNVTNSSTLMLPVNWTLFPPPPINNTSPVFSLHHGRAASGIKLVTYILKGHSQTALALLEKKYTFINARLYLKRPVSTLGLRMYLDLYTSCRAMTVVERYQLLFRQFSMLVDLVNLACDYEAVPLGSKDDALSKSLNLTRVYLNDIIRESRRGLVKRNAAVPTVTKVLESTLNMTTKDWLTYLQKYNLGVPPTDTNIKIYRNYVIVYVIHTASDYAPRYGCLPA